MDLSLFRARRIYKKYGGSLIFFCKFFGNCLSGKQKVFSRQNAVPSVMPVSLPGKHEVFSRLALDNYMGFYK
jgi:uncharacterized Fe-S cluster protein YjdI